jgi:hypothetical protein
MKSVVLSEMKTELKSMAAQIRTNRPLARAAESNQARNLPFEYPTPNPYALSEQFRFLHIVYCLMRGRTMEQIEQKRRYTPYAFQARIDRLRGIYQPRLDAERAQAAQEAAPEAVHDVG